jgi:Glycosyltransferase
VRCFDVFVLSSLNEGISNTVLEAMASGVPVIATAVGGNVEIVEDGRWGRLFASGDVAALAAHIEDYVDRPEVREAHGRAARAAATRRFALTTMVERYQALYESTLHLPFPAKEGGNSLHANSGTSIERDVDRSANAAASAPVGNRQSTSG